MVIYLDENMIVKAKITEIPWKGKTGDGYGKNLPTRYMIQLDNKRWYRVKAICYSNAVSLYINVGAAGRRFLDGSCEDVIYNKVGQ